MEGAGNNAVELAEAYYLAAGRSVLEMQADGICQDVFVCTPALVLMARKVDSSAPVCRIIAVSVNFPPEKCDAWHLHFLAGDMRELLRYEPVILSMPWILTQHGKRGDGRLVKLSAARFCRHLKVSSQQHHVADDRQHHQRVEVKKKWSG